MVTGKRKHISGTEGAVQQGSGTSIALIDIFLSPRRLGGRGGTVALSRW